MAFICKRCSFRFESKNVKECPYCGRREGIEREKNASELLEEVEGLLSGE
ncbi:hypothetical protein J4221_05580 [Candidatus Pacearchaeota archaeon]|nr:hypothetical protein [Candidatus Pacearchaeota archaeon]